MAWPRPPRVDSAGTGLSFSQGRHHMAGMTHVDDRRHERRLDRLERQLPEAAARTFRWLRNPGARWVRIPFGGLLVLGSLLSFLPVLGLWMLPLGLLLLAQDVPFV